MKKLKQRLTAFLLMTITILSSVPPIDVFANKQTAVKDLVIINDSIAPHPNYDFNLSWKKPSMASGIPPHNVEGFIVEMRNASKGEGYQEVGQVPAGSQQYNFASSNIKESFESGSIYSFRVNPYHFHTVTKPDGTSYQEAAPIDGTNKEYLFMTDILVEAEGMGNSITVTWDNPTFQGSDVFTGYKIFYTPQEYGDPTMPQNPSTTVKMADLTRLPDGRVQYTFSDSTIKPAELYCIKVEPMYNDLEIRKDGPKEIPINGKRYSITFKEYSREYRKNNVHVKLDLKVVDEGLDKVKLEWTDLSQIVFNPRQLTIFESDFEDFRIEKIIGTLGANAIRDVNTYITGKPGYQKYYKVRLEYEMDGKVGYIESVIATYIPGQVDFGPYAPIIRHAEDSTEEVKEKPITMNVYWDAFERKPYNKEEEEDLMPNGKYLDRKVKYRVWITDNPDNFNQAGMVKEYIGEYSGSLLEEMLYPFTDKDSNGNTIPIEDKRYVYKMDFSEYVRKNESGAFEKVPLDDNKVYYIKIEAEREDAIPIQISKPAFYSHYIPLLDSLDDRPITVSRPPFRVKEENGVQQVTDSTITVQWNKVWYEVYNADDDSWYSLVGIKDGKVVFGDDTKGLPSDKIFKLYSDEFYDKGLANVNSVLSANGINLPAREQRLKDDVKYEMYWVKQDEVGSDYEGLYNQLKDDESGNLWKTIEATDDPKYPEYTIEGLEPNTSYYIFFRPYYEDDNGKKTAYLPSVVVGTTTNVRPPVEIVPTVPNLEVVETGDFYITVKWKYTKEFGYELAIGEKSAKTPVEGGKTYLWEDIKASQDFKVEGEYAYFTFRDLFPLTTYYMWIRAFREPTEEQETETLYSEWSNPVSAKTKDILPPDPPKGLGPASTKSLGVYNRENETSYKSFGKDVEGVDENGKEIIGPFANYMVVEWMRNPNDREPVKGDLEAGNSKWLSTEELDSSYMALFGQLVANKDYYIRAKTKLVVKRDGDKINKTYHYIVQIALDPDFIDYTEITIPPAEDGLVEGSNVIIKESEWSNAIVLYTQTSDDEYDGDKNPNQYPLPTEDFEIIYDSAENTLTYKYRSDGVGTDGKDDNYVDQRLISRLITEKVYDYKIEMTNYQNKTIKNRVIEMPYSIVRALDERKINMVIYADNLTLKIPYDALNTAEVKNTSDYGRGSTLKININSNAEGIPALDENMHYASRPNKLNISIKTPSKTINLKQLEKEMDLNLKLNNRFNTLDYNIKNYFSDGNSGGYAPISSDYAKIPGTINSKTKNVGNFAAIAVGTSVSPSTGGASATVLMDINSKILLDGLNNYDPEVSINTTQFNNILAAVAKDEKSVKVNDAITEENLANLGKAGMLVSGTTVKREAGIAALTRLYELKTGASIKDYQNEIPQDLDQVSENYKTLIQKAYAMELFDGDTVSPGDELKFGDFMEMLDIVLVDVGY